MTVMAPGSGPCPACRRLVLFALAANGDLLALDPDEAGPVAAYLDIARISRCCPAGPGTAVRERFAPHACRPQVAKVIPLRAARDRRLSETRRSVS